MSRSRPWWRVRLALAAPVMLVAACGGAPLLAPVPPVTSATPGPDALPAAPSPAPDASASPAASAYVGHGVETLAPEVLAKYRPRRAVTGRLAPHRVAHGRARARHRAALSPDGKSLYFSWSITGIGQIWRVDGPRHFPAAAHRRRGQHVARGHHARRALSRHPARPQGRREPGTLPAAGRGRSPRSHPARPRGADALRSRVERLEVRVLHRQRPASPTRTSSTGGTSTKKERQVVFDGSGASPPPGAPPSPSTGAAAQAPTQAGGLWHVSDLKDDGRLLLRKETGSLTAEYLRVGPGASRIDPSPRTGRDRGVRRALRGPRG